MVAEHTAGYGADTRGVARHGVARVSPMGSASTGVSGGRTADADATAGYTPAGSTEAGRPAPLSVELVVQYRDESRADQYHLQRTQHRVAAGSTIRQLLQRATLQGLPGVTDVTDVAGHEASAREVASQVLDVKGRKAQEGTQSAGQMAATLIAAIEQKRLGLSRFGRRAWLDDPLQPNDRIEILCPVVADVKAARFERVTKARAARNQRPGNMKARG